jgi:transposase
VPCCASRRAHDLAVFAAEVLGENPFSVVVLVFRSKRAVRLKILAWDGSGLTSFCSQNLCKGN